jgi:hypothetical protein
MTDRTHLDEVVATTGDAFAKSLLEAFREMVRHPQVGTVDYAPKLRALMEERLQVLGDASD